MRLCAAFALLASFAALGLQGSPILLTISSLPGQDATGTYVGFMPAGIAGEDPLRVICDDDLHTTFVPNTIRMEVSGIPDLTYARFGNSQESLVLYERAVLLAEKAFTAPADRVGEYQWAVWALFLPGLSISSQATEQLQWSAAAVNLPHDYSRARIFTPTIEGIDGTSNDARGVPNAGNQEFITVNPVPEPSSQVLVIFALAGLALAVRCYNHSTKR